MKTKLGLACVVVGTMTFSSALSLIGCGDDGAKGGGAQSSGAGAGGDSAGGASSTHVGGADTGGTSSSAHAGRSSTGARPNVDPGGPGSAGAGVAGEPAMPGAAGADTTSPDGGADSPDFDGIDLSPVPDTAPPSCIGGFDPDSGTLGIALDGNNSVVHLVVHNGVIMANGTKCASKAGDPAAADKVQTLNITGGKTADLVFLDLSGEPFTGCFGKDGAINIDLGGGSDAVDILGTLGPDKFHVGSDKDLLVLDLTGDDRVDVSISGTPSVLLSTGAKDDEVLADGVALGVQPAALPLDIYGGGARDALVGGAAADHLYGGIGDDWFDAGTAPVSGDYFDGGDGRDTIDFSARTAPLTITVGNGADDGEAGEAANIAASVEVVYGSQGKNDMTAGDGGSTLWGGAADDVLKGGPGGDTLNGGKGDDALTGGPGDDYLYGDDGDDTLDGGAGDDLLDGGKGKNTLIGGPGDGDVCVVTKTDTASTCEL